MSASVHFTKAHAAPQSGSAGWAGKKEQASGKGISAQTEFRKAGLLDLPFIFNQIMDGCAEGAFTDRFLCGSGSVVLFRLLFVDLLPFGKLLGKRNHYDFHIFRNGRDEIGFAGLCSPRQNDELKDTVVISFFGIAPEYRGKGYGTKMMRCLIERLPADVRRIATFTATHTTSMKRLLAKTGFRQPVRQPEGFSDCKLRVFLLENPGLLKKPGLR
jgi:GNAT superfamily N-acetyltransferase